MNNYLILLALVALCSCTSSQPAAHAPSATSTAAASQWTTNNVEGLVIELVDSVRLEYMQFVPKGRVLMTIGQKNGLAMAPIYYWQLDSGRLRIGGLGNNFYDELTLVSRDATKIVARRRNGEVVTYDIRSK